MSQAESRHDAIIRCEREMGEALEVLRRVTPATPLHEIRAAKAKYQAAEDERQKIERRRK